MLHSETQDGYSIDVPSTFHGYKIMKYLGCGSTCVVVLVQNLKTKEQFAAKIISINDIIKRKLVKSIKKEISVLKQLNHPNIIKIEETCKIRNKDEEYYVIIMEYCPNGDLLSYATKHCFKSEHEKKKMFYSFIEAVKYLHSKGIAHGDIKSENILLDSNNSPKLCDFGFCKTSPIVGDESKNGTLYYGAPELFVKGSYDPKKSDIWAIGITLYSLCELQFPFKDGKQNYIIKQIMNAKLSISKSLDPQIRQIVDGCTKLNPDERITIDQILNSNFFSEVRNEKAPLSKNNNNNTISKYQAYEQRLSNSSGEEPDIYEPILIY